MSDNGRGNGKNSSAEFYQRGVKGTNYGTQIIQQNMQMRNEGMDIL